MRWADVRRNIAIEGSCRQSIYASFSLPCLPARVFSLNTERPLSLAGTGLHAPKAAAPMESTGRAAAMAIR